MVVSSDLSHYHEYESAQRFDRWTGDAMGPLDGEAGRDGAWTPEDPRAAARREGTGPDCTNDRLSQLG